MRVLLLFRIRLASSPCSFLWSQSPRVCARTAPFLNLPRTRSPSCLHVKEALEANKAKKREIPGKTQICSKVLLPQSLTCLFSSRSPRGTCEHPSSCSHVSCFLSTPPLPRFLGCPPRLPSPPRPRDDSWASTSPGLSAEPDASGRSLFSKHSFHLVSGRHPLLVCPLAPCQSSCGCSSPGASAAPGSVPGSPRAPWVPSVCCSRQHHTCLPWALRGGF